ncbi:4-diphosphocytidyl-2C-methyl-D-erythritol synthase [Sphingopyxis sp. QXT-31]|uniref:nucleotidyltransferase family protein n=1 Tax=Sphingopyxis sp. QXT-31 TaxID=1357916 RepID=UPI0009790740|nr:nucleotidyltransferase family protein [Sphingopyxis sp. QXT-31]APZ99017.1 4-diphosphocytidyl-2C-methyl-D-erythritol synthase [Sphingopyxis sp. QXT-31]
MTIKIPAIVMAGSRPGPDPLLSGTNVSTKALLPIAGRPMLVHVVTSLRACPRVGPITILAQNSTELAAEPGLAGLADLHFSDSGQGISSSLAAALPPGDDPVLVTTADNVLLTPAMIAEFLDGAEGSDVAVAMVERDVLLARYPESKRTWLKFRGGCWSGANMFRLRGRRVLPLLDFWGRIERDRKKGLKIVAAFGPWLLIGALLRMFTIQQGVARAGLRFGLNATVVPMSDPEACIDADKPVDIELIEKIMADRAAL